MVSLMLTGRNNKVIDGGLEQLAPSTTLSTTTAVVVGRTLTGLLNIHLYGMPPKRRRS